MMKKNENAVELIIFDWDGTLCDSLTSIVAAFQHSAADIGFEILKRSEISQIVGLSLSEAIQILYPDAKTNEIQRFSTLYSKHYRLINDPVLFPGIERMLQNLILSGCFIAVATGKSRQGLKRDLDKLNLTKFFKITKTADFSAPKPNPQMLDEICEELFIDRDNAVMIGDTDFDVIMAQNANMRSIAVSYGAHSKERLLQSIPDIVVSNPIELEESIISLL